MTEPSTRDLVRLAAEAQDKGHALPFGSQERNALIEQSTAYLVQARKIHEDRARDR